MPTSPDSHFLVREVDPRDIDGILRLNRAWEHFTSPLDEHFLSLLLQRAAYHRVVESDGRVVAFLIAVAPGAGHDSVNYVWFDSRGDDFLNIDRIVVDDAAQRAGLGLMLYRDVASFARCSGVSRLVCEVDIEPMNHGSDAFHRRFGFVEVGTQSVPPKGKRVSLREYVLGS